MSNAYIFSRADHAILLCKVTDRQEDESLMPLALQVTYRAPPGAIGECGAFFNALALEPGLLEFVQHSGADLYRRYCGLIFSRVYSAQGVALKEIHTYPLTSFHGVRRRDADECYCTSLHKEPNKSSARTENESSSRDVR
jgi:hypothetical protein